MKKVILPVLVALVSVLSFGLERASAQTYQTSIGLGIDLGDGPTLVGPQVKHFFDSQNAGNAQVLFGDHFTLLGVDYSYNEAFAGTNGLSWYLGVGPQLGFVADQTLFAIRPAAGLEYKIPSAPIGFHFDWKPWWNLSNNSNFEPARFTLGFKYTLN